MIGNDRREREPMIVGVPKETIPGERRVALVPGVLPSLTGKGFEVLVEAGAGVAAFSMELMPRITRAQSMDALSSMATIAGYKAVLLAAEYLPRMFPDADDGGGDDGAGEGVRGGRGRGGFAGDCDGAAVGRVVSAYDVRPAVREQVESVGAKFVELPLEVEGAEDKGGYAQAQDESFYRRQREMMARVLRRATW
jgi:H+-translocating NAD(P) transhydrogenase subunit alpha